VNAGLDIRRYILQSLKSEDSENVLPLIIFVVVNSRSVWSPKALRSTTKQTLRNRFAVMEPIEKGNRKLCLPGSSCHRHEHSALVADKFALDKIDCPQFDMGEVESQIPKLWRQESSRCKSLSSANLSATSALCSWRWQLEPGRQKLAIALLYRLITAKRFRSVCFVVDRSALGDQTEREFTTTKIMSGRTFLRHLRT